MLVIAAHLYSASWWQAVCYTMAAVLILLLFSSFGLCGSMTAMMVKRADRWFEHLGLVFGFIGGAALIAIGFVGAWMLFRSTVLSL